MELAPDTWSALVEDDRTKTIIAPFVGFFDIGKGNTTVSHAL